MKERLALLLAVTITFLCLPARAAELDQAERSVVGAVKSRIPVATEFLEKIVNINSGTMNQEGVREVGRIFREELDALGFQTRWVEMPTEVKRAGHLIAKRSGRNGKKLLLLGHLDTVFEKDSPLQKWTRVGERVKGPGVMDMKGGLVVVLEALRALHSVKALEDITIAVMFTGDEERPGEPISISRADLVALAKESDIALSFEPLITRIGGVDTATTARRGLTFWSLTTQW